MQFHPVLDRLTAALLLAFGCPASSAALLDDEQGHLRYVAAAGSTAPKIIGTEVAVGTGIAGWAVQTGQPIEVADVTSDPRFAHDVAAATGYIPTRIATAPILTADDVLGVLQVLDATRGDLELLSAFADLAAAALRRPAADVPEQLTGIVRRLSDATDGERATAVRLVTAFLDHTAPR